MATSRVVEYLDVVEDIAAGQIPGWIDLAPDALTFEQLKEALGHGVVMGPTCGRACACSPSVTAGLRA